MKLLTLIPKIPRRIYFEYRTILWRISRRFRKSKTLATKQGVFTLLLEVDDPISKSLYVRGEYELDLVSEAMCFIRKLKELPKGKGTVLDIGANNGIISIGMIVTGELDKAIAIEPEPRNFSVLRKNVEQNHLESAIICLNYAVSDSKSTLQFELSETNYGDHRVRIQKSLADTNLKELYSESKRQVIDIEANTLDNLLADLNERICDDISVIWIDVQGYEGYVFSGAKRLLSNDIPVVSEIWPYGIQRAGMSQKEFCAIVKEIWSAYWVKRRGRFVKYPIDIFYTYLDELAYDRDFDNVIFTK